MFPEVLGHICEQMCREAIYGLLVEILTSVLALISWQTAMLHLKNVILKQIQS